MYLFAKTAIGYNHIRNKTPCQDFSFHYQDGERSILSVCDGHGGRQYIRSALGSRFACNAVLDSFRELSIKEITKNTPEFQKKLKLSLLCRWNDQVKNHLEHHRFIEKELSALTMEEKEKLKKNPEKAYGTTLIGGMVLYRKIILTKLGDGEALLIKNGNIVPVFDESDEPVANITNSLCAEDAFYHLKIAVADLSKIDGFLLCTDGVINPYQNYENFNSSVVHPICKTLIEEKSTSKIADFVEELGKKLGIGDDVSLAFAIKEGLKEEVYL